MTERDVIVCITPGCNVNVSRPIVDALPSGVFVHDEAPPFPHEANDPGAPLPDYAAQIASLTEALDQLILDNLMGGM